MSALNTKCPPYEPYPAIPSRTPKSEKTQPKLALVPTTDEEKVNLILSVGEECITPEELRNLVAKKPDFRLYDGFEPSGRMHIAQGVFKAVNVNKCTSAGGIFVFWVADWFALMNGKMGGDIDKIKVVGEYFIEVWKASGMDMNRVQFAWAADEITKNDQKYWTLCLDVGRRFSLARVKKCCQIMGRKEDSLTAAQILYPLMQCTDVFFLNANICQLGVDQRKVNMLAREYCDQAGIKLKPIILSHHMLYGLGVGQAKMSKSQPDSAIFMEDSEEEVRRKILKAYCPAKPEGTAAAPAKDDEESMLLVEDDLKNPCLDYIQHIVLSRPGAVFETATKTYDTFSDVKADFVGGKLSEHDLKEALITAVNKLIQPVRDHFVNDAHARDVLAKVHQFKQEDAARVDEPKPVPCLRAVDRAQDTCLVFAPFAEGDLSLSTVLDLLLLVRINLLNRKVVLWLPNLTSFVRNRMDGNQKAIDAWYTMLVESMRAISGSEMEHVTVIRQSDAIFSDSGKYWISVINVGRVHSVAQVLQADPSVTQAGEVIGVLMHIADVMAVSPSRIVCHASWRPLHELAVEYLKSIQNTPDAPKVPTIVDAPCADLRLKPTETLPVDDHILITDLPADVKRKVKSAFCEPGNADVCPPLVLAEVCMAVKPTSLEISRKEENGGNLSFAESSRLRAEFASGQLHPGDLKPAVTKLVDSFVQACRDRTKANEDMKRADAALKTASKQQSKKAKK